MASVPMSSPSPFHHARLLVVGDIMLDRYWFGDVNRISPEAPVPVVLIGRADDRLGGAANVARNASSLGALVRLLGVIGDDEPGRRVAELLKVASVDAGLLQDTACPTTIKLRVLGRQQQLLRIDFEHRPQQITLTGIEALLTESLSGCDMVVFSDYGKGCLANVQSLIMQARAQQKPVLIDPKGHDYERYRGATVLSPNRAELRQVVGDWSSEDDLRQRAQRLRESLALEALLLTRSEEGMTLYRAGEEWHVKAQAREVFDVSGAGDTVLATMAAALAAGWGWQDAVALANQAGGIVVGKVGTAVIRLDELQESWGKAW